MSERAYYIFIYAQMTAQEITPEQLIDTSENKPIVEVESQEQEDNTPTAETIQQIPLKAISQLTKEEREILLNNAKNNIENDNYKVTFFKNGNHRITKKKPSRESTASKIIRENKGMTNEQLLFEHVINLESQIAVLRQKHKNLKRNYKQIYEDVYVDDENAYDEQPIQEQSIQQETIQQQQSQSQSTIQQTTNYRPKITARGYRARLQRLQ